MKEDKMKLKVSKSQWLEMGKVGGWLKTAGGFGHVPGLDTPDDLIKTHPEVSDFMQKNPKFQEWIKNAPYPYPSEDLNDILEGKVLSNKDKTTQEIVILINDDPEIVKKMQEQGLAENYLVKFINETKKIYRLK
jgi:hypothetical protein